jgi:hypothetical protein
MRNEYQWTEKKQRCAVDPSAKLGRGRLLCQEKRAGRMIVRGVIPNAFPLS